MIRSKARPGPGGCASGASSGSDRVESHPILVVEGTLDRTPLPRDAATSSSNVELSPGPTVDFLVAVAATDKALICPNDAHRPCKLSPLAWVADELRLYNSVVVGLLQYLLDTVYHLEAR